MIMNKEFLIDELSRNKQEIVNIEQQLEILKPKINMLEENMRSILEEEKVFKANESQSLDDWFFSKTYLKGEDRKTDRRRLVTLYWRDPSTPTRFKEKLTKFDLLHLKHYKENRMIMERDLNILNSRWDEYTKKKSAEENGAIVGTSMNINYILNNREYRLIQSTSKAFDFVKEYLVLEHTYKALEEELRARRARDLELSEEIYMIQSANN